MKLSSFNCRNFKSNYLAIDKLTELEIDIIFICEHWLNTNEQNLINDRYISKYNCYFQSDMDINFDKNKNGRPFGGKCWLVNKKIHVESFDFTHPDFSILKINDNYGNTVVFIGLWLTFYNQTLERLANFKSNLAAIEAVLNDSPVESVIMGDLNSDLRRNNPYDKLVRDLILRKKLSNPFDKFLSQSYHTYENGEYKSAIDFFLIKEDFSNRIKDAYILDILINNSDHKPIFCEIEKNKTNFLQTDPQSLKAENSFYRFNWKNLIFQLSYKNKLAEILKDIVILIKNTSVGTEKKKIDYIHDVLPKLMIKAARSVDCRRKKRFNIRANKNEINQEIKNLENEKNEINSEIILNPDSRSLKKKLKNINKKSSQTKYLYGAKKTGFKFRKML